ncbi:Aste57867_12280 [Aphanomyces stellatus]|uniref:Aste57867_12280 protein n=1 Tax=Aphanomyces stellatus TaxID=120398 RepID=A0A485KVL2_9STRA|nr:hypothetical protein As57867_012235 [Aphanomyces stellatus]VFT89133.1 Aste57867_12280 [Aphanomyces stellatus]
MSGGILATFLRERGLVLAGVGIGALYYMEWTGEAIAFMQDYGWFVVFGIGLLLYLDHQFALQLAHWDRRQSLNAANAPERVEILAIEARKVRERQQAAMEEQIKASQAAVALKKKAKPSPPKQTAPPSREYNPLQGAGSTRYQPSGFQRPRGG